MIEADPYRGRQRVGPCHLNAGGRNTLPPESVV